MARVSTYSSPALWADCCAVRQVCSARSRFFGICLQLTRNTSISGEKHGKCRDAGHGPSLLKQRCIAAGESEAEAQGELRQKHTAADLSTRECFSSRPDRFRRNCRARLRSACSSRISASSRRNVQCHSLSGRLRQRALARRICARLSSSAPCRNLQRASGNPPPGRHGRVGANRTQPDAAYQDDPQ